MQKTFLTLVILLLVASGVAYVGNDYSRRQYCDGKICRDNSYIIAQDRVLRNFNLIDPEQSPPAIHDSVMRGYRLFLHTAYYAPNYAKNELSCGCCHFVGGNTFGGKNGGISLVGVTKIYPQYSERDKKNIDLSQRITNCFRRSLNGIAPSLDSREMYDILNYLKWISVPAENLKEIPWLGLPALKSTHQPDAQHGQKLYLQFCAACHREDGEGGGSLMEEDGKIIPPLWGQKSYNDGAGMNMIKKLAPFIHLNMPYQQAILTEEEALDVAAYIIQQPRPHFNP